MLMSVSDGKRNPPDTVQARGLTIVEETMPSKVESRQKKEEGHAWLLVDLPISRSSQHCDADACPLSCTVSFFASSLRVKK